MGGRRLPGRVASTLMALAALLLLAQGFAAWSMVLGLDGAGGLEALAPGLRNLVVALAVLSPVAGVGAWFRAQWGPVLWGIAVVTLVGAVAFDVLHPALRPLLVAHGALMASWLIAIAFTERRATPAVMDD